MLPCAFGGTAGWPQKLFGCPPVCDPGTNEHEQPCRIGVPPRPVTSRFSRRGATQWRDARRRPRAHVRAVASASGENRMSGRRAARVRKDCARTCARPARAVWCNGIEARCSFRVSRRAAHPLGIGRDPCCLRSRRAGCDFARRGEPGGGKSRHMRVDRAANVRFGGKADTTIALRKSSYGPKRTFRDLT